MDERKLKELQKEFIKELGQRFALHCKSRGIEENLENYTKFLIGCSIIRHREINNFMVVSCYPKVLKANDGRKCRAIWNLEDIIPLKQTQIKTVLKHYSKEFRFNKNLLA